MEAHEHDVVAEALQSGLAHVVCRGPLATEVDHARRDYCFWVSTIKDSEDSPKSICDDYRYHMGQSWSAFAGGLRRVICATTINPVCFSIIIGARDGIARISKGELEMRTNPTALSRS